MKVKAELGHSVPLGKMLDSGKELKLCHPSAARFEESVTNSIYMDIIIQHSQWMLAGKVADIL